MQFAERSSERDNDLYRFSSRHAVDSVEESDAGSPIIDSFCNSVQGVTKRVDEKFLVFQIRILRTIVHIAQIWIA